MAKTDLPCLDRWRLVADADDELGIAGEIDGRPDGGAFASYFQPDVVVLRDGRRLRLGMPHPDTAGEPWAWPEGYHDRRRERLTAVLKALGRGEGPSAAEIAAAPLLDAWQQTSSNEGMTVLVGVVSGHPRLLDGPVTTSPLLLLDVERGFARTVSRWYRIGRSLSDYLRDSQPAADEDPSPPAQRTS